MHEEYMMRGVNYVRIDKRKARIKYNEGKTIYLIQDGIRLRIAWCNYSPINKFESSDFDNVVSHFMYDNGKRGIKYFIKQEDCV